MIQTCLPHGPDAPPGFRAEVHKTGSNSSFHLVGACGNAQGEIYFVPATKGYGEDRTYSSTEGLLGVTWREPNSRLFAQHVTYVYVPEGSESNDVRVITYGWLFGLTPELAESLGHWKGSEEFLSSARSFLTSDDFNKRAHGKTFHRDLVTSALERRLLYSGHLAASVPELGKRIRPEDGRTWPGWHLSHSTSVFEAREGWSSHYIPPYDSSIRRNHFEGGPTPSLAAIGCLPDLCPPGVEGSLNTTLWPFALWVASKGGWEISGAMVFVGHAMGWSSDRYDTSSFDFDPTIALTEGPFGTRAILEAIVKDMNSRGAYLALE